MKLNLSILRDHIGSEYFVKIYGHMPKSRTLERPRLYTAGSKMNANTLYVTQCDALPAVPQSSSCTVICTEGKLPQGWVHGNVSVMMVNGIREAVTLFHVIQEAFDKFQNWELALAEELAKDSDFDICRVIQLGVAILENPVSMMDSAMQIIFSSTIHQSGDLQSIFVDDQVKPLDMEQTLTIKKACNQERMIRTPYLSSVGLQGKSYCYNIYPMGHFAGCAWLCDDNRAFRDSDFALADYFFHIFQKAYQKHLRTKTDTESPKVTALSKLLKHKPITAQEYDMLKLDTASVKEK